MEKIPAPLRNWLYRHPVLCVFLFILYTIFVSGASWVIALKSQSNSVKVECRQQTQVIGEQTSKKEIDQTQNICVTEKFSENENRWGTKFYNRRKDGFWCPFESYVDPVMWYSEGLNLNFQKITIEYEIKKNEKSGYNNPPTFVFSYGKDKPILKLWTPENPNLQLFRFAKNLNFDSKGATLASDLAETLSEPVKVDRVDSFVMESTHREGNDLFLKFTYIYTSSRLDKGVDDPFQKRVKVPVSNILESTEKYPFGVGTYRGNCIRPVSYTICQ